MGNVSGKEEGENGGDDPSVRSSCREVEDGLGKASSPVNSVGRTPPGSPGRSRSPLLFAPQVPLAPLQRTADVPPAYEDYCMGDFNGSLDLPTVKRIPTLITWNYGGKDVSVEGSWDGWKTRRTLQNSGKDHSILLVLPCGIYHYKFFVDGEWRYNPDLPIFTDETGRCNNLLNVTDYVPEILDSVAEFELPLSPDSSYSRPYPAEEDFDKEPPAVPQQLHCTVLGTVTDEETSVKPQHVVLNHVYIEKGWASKSLVSVGITNRYQSKYVTVVLYKPLKR